MEFNTDSSEIDDIVEQLKATSVPANKPVFKKEEPPQEKVDNENVENYIYDKSSALIDSTFEVIESMKGMITAGVDPKEVMAFAALINTAVKSIGTLNDINLQNKQSKNNLEVKKIEMTAKGKMIENMQHTTNIVIGTREDILNRKTLPASKQAEILDITTD